MKKHSLLLLAFTLFSLKTIAQTDIVGNWLNEEKTAKIQIYKTNDKYFGKLLPSPKLYEADGKTPKKDVNNPVESLRNRTMINLNIVTNMVHNGNEWGEGNIYDPKNGKTYKCIMTLEGNKLKIRGFIGVSLFGRSTTWTRL